MTQIIGQYEVERELGRSPRATLYIGTRKHDGLRVILKEFVIPADTLPEFRPKYVARYLSECDWLTHINHPNIIKALEVIKPGPERETPVLVMEHLDVSLNQLYQREEVLDPQDVAGWTVQVLNGANAFHQHGINHRDIKPSNVMLDSKGVPKIIDLSIAVQIGMDITLSMDDISTQYAAPELYQGSKGANFATDIYSIGFMAYQLLCGRDRFEAEFSGLLTDDARQNTMRWINWHCDENAILRPLNDVRPEIPEYLSSIVSKMTAKRLTDRYQSIDDVLGDLAADAREDRDVLSIIVTQYISPEYWRDPGSYRISEDSTTASDHAPDEDKATDAGVLSTTDRKTKKKIATIAVVCGAIVLLIAGGGYIAYLHRVNVAISAKVQNLYKETLGAYDSSAYDATRSYAGEGIAYIESVNKEAKFAGFVQSFEYLQSDSDWVEGLEQRLAEALEAKEAGDRTQSSLIADELLAVKYDREHRSDNIDQRTGSKIESVQARAQDLKSWVAEENAKDATMEAVAGDLEPFIVAGKYRQALHFALVSDLDKSRRDELVAGVQPVVDYLNAGRTAYREKRFNEAELNFADAFERSGGRSLEALYYLEKIRLWARCSMDPGISEFANALKAWPDSVETRLLRIEYELTGLFVRKYDLDHPGLDNEVQGFFPALESLRNELAGLIRAEDLYGELDHALLDAIQFPIEDSRKYYQQLLVDLEILSFRMALESGDVTDAASGLDGIQDWLTEGDRAYWSARQAEVSASANPEVRDTVLSQVAQTYETLLEDYPHWAECHYRLAHIYRLIDDYETALQQFSLAVDGMPENERFRWWGARAAEERAFALLNLGDSVGARQACEMALLFWDDFPCAYFTLAMTYQEEDPEKFDYYLSKFEESYANRRYAFLDEENNFSVYQKIQSSAEGAPGKVVSAEAS
ncbi:MAG: hypothetical protein AMXMBFR82_23570 [Candidatus Hydrogenedentota bacterium]